MSDLSICLCQMNFPGLTAEEFLTVAERAGAQSVDLHPRMGDEPLSAVIDAAERSPVGVVLVSPLPDWYAQTENGTQLPPTFMELAEVAAATGGRIGAPSPLRDAGAPGPPDASLAEALHLMHKQAKLQGATLALEPVGRSLMRPGAVGCIKHLDAARAFLHRHDLPLALVADSFCLATAGVELGAPWSLEDVCTVQLADADPSADARRLPGDGSLPLSEWLAGMEGPAVPIGIEVFPLARPEDPSGLARDLVDRTAALFAKRLLP